MICPKCNAEYRDGFTKCADCGILLVADLATELEEDSAGGKEDLESVLHSQDSNFVFEVVTAIEVQNIPYMLQSGTAFGYSRQFQGRRPSVDWEAYLYVPGDRKQDVVKILTEVQDRLNAKKDDKT